MAQEAVACLIDIIEKRERPYKSLYRFPILKEKLQKFLKSS